MCTRCLVLRIAAACKHDPSRVGRVVARVRGDTALAARAIGLFSAVAPDVSDAVVEAFVEAGDALALIERGGPAADATIVALCERVFRTASDPVWAAGVAAAMGYLGAAARHARARRPFLRA